MTLSNHEESAAGVTVTCQKPRDDGTFTVAGYSGSSVHFLVYVTVGSTVLSTLIVIGNLLEAKFLSVESCSHYKVVQVAVVCALIQIGKLCFSC